MLPLRGGGSGLARLHVGGDGPSLRQALEALVGVVEENPVLGLEVGLRGTGCRRTQAQMLSRCFLKSLSSLLEYFEYFKYIILYSCAFIL